MMKSECESSPSRPPSTVTFDNAQRNNKDDSTRTLTWPQCIAHHVTFLVIKFAFCFAFYTIQFKSHQIESPPINPSLSEHLAEFRKDSRSSRHELVLQNMVRSRKLAGEDNDNDSMSNEPYYWTPLQTQCSASSPEMLDPFPDSFDAVFYKAQHDEDYEHFQEHGRENGWNCTRGQYLRDIIGTEIVPLLPGNILEIGPFINPLLRNTVPNMNMKNSNLSSRKVQYFDVAGWDDLKLKAEQLGYMPSPDAIEIDFIDPSGDLSTIASLHNNGDTTKTKFSMVVSSNVIGVQLDLTRHLQQVGNLLPEGGYYTVMVPDKRFSRNHFATETTIADVLQDYFSTPSGVPTKHKLRSLVEHEALLQDAANDSAEKNWHGEHGFPYEDASDVTFLNKLKAAIDQFKEGKSSVESVDVLQYQFTPQSLAFVVDTLYALGLTDLRVHRLYETLADSDEFSMVLKRCTPV